MWKNSHALLALDLGYNGIKTGLTIKLGIVSSPVASVVMIDSMSSFLARPPKKHVMPTHGISSAGRGQNGSDAPIKRNKLCGAFVSVARCESILFSPSLASVSVPRLRLPIPFSSRTASPSNTDKSFSASRRLELPFNTPRSLCLPLSRFSLNRPPVSVRLILAGMENCRKASHDSKNIDRQSR